MEVDSIYAEKSRISVVTIIAIVAPIVFVSLVTFVACWIIYTRARRNKKIQEPDESGMASNLTLFVTFF